MPVADPGRSRPPQAIELDRGISRQGLAGQPELVASAAVQLAPDGLDGRLRAIRGETAAADLQLQHLQRGPEVRREQIVEDLRALTPRIVDEQPGVATTAADRADALEDGTGVSAVNDDRNPVWREDGRHLGLVAWPGGLCVGNRRAERCHHRHDGRESRRATPRSHARPHIRLRVPGHSPATGTIRAAVRDGASTVKAATSLSAMWAAKTFVT